MYFDSVLASLLNFKYRDRVTIVSDILKSITKRQEGRRKTNIMQSANLNYDQVNKYLEFMLANGYIQVDASGVRGGASYKATKKGLSFVRTFESLTRSR